MALALPAELAGSLTEREAIADTLHRAVLAFDNADDALLLSAITEDISVEMLGFSAKGVAEIKAAVFDRVSKLDTTHFLSNIRVSIESATTAKVTCSALSQHVRPGKGLEPGSSKFTAGGMYLCDVVKVGSLWKISAWKMNIVWTEGDQTVMEGQ
ncbi:hypothetical protein BKA67DRAFT_552320 [Truncatella angustata]|uniref:SnoaL-like domain-containing protein n=1 Tax=Truncatella angustata TaxID=152316 RepID=A0A9P8UQV3_9PEZI|nr:uncharacterized protein BKA67DRAFT_552320 [Truncatella angustata]KAH6656559.1 hypothetical protein BKA67DRAFT_552320 [Truncatella angustata]KAH8196532.1 hypothetical protein TruAng_009294 [Truncatella angustata]